MRVLGLSTYPVEAAATRYRMSQYVEPLSKHGIELEIYPFLSTEQFQQLYRSGGITAKISGMLASLIKRSALAAKMRKYDAIFVQREAMLFGPAFFEWLYSAVGNIPLVLDLDDATYLNYVSPVYGKYLSKLKFFGKTEKLIERSAVVICGNQNIATFVESKGKKTVVIPTIVDQEVFRPIETDNEVPVIGWIGTHSTFPFLEKIFPALQEASRNFDFKLKIVGAGTNDIDLDGVNVENSEWSLERDAADFQALDIGLYPLFVTDLVSEEWLLGKSGFKAIQYLAVGVPFIMSPVGICNEIGIAGETHLNAKSIKEWKDALELLLSNRAKRLEMGKAGRSYSLEHFGLNENTELLVRVLSEATNDHRQAKK